MEYDIRFCKTVDGRRIAYGTVGSGPPVLISAGRASHLELELDTGPMGAVFRHLAESFRLIRYDRAGTGLSERWFEIPTPETLRHEIEAVVAAVGLQRFSLVGISSAGPIIIDYVLAHPDRVERVVLYCTWAGRPGNRVDPRRQRLREIEPGLAERELIERLMPSGGSREVIQRFTEFSRKAEASAGARDSMDEVQWEDQRPLLERIVAPTVVLHRLEDRVVSVGFGRQLAALIPNARFVPLPGGNHIPGSDDEQADVAARIRDFLLETPPAAAQATAGGEFRTILFTDVVASTPLLAQLKDEKMREVMRDHDAVMETAVNGHGGRVVKTIGDAFMAEFAVPSAALDAAIQAQRAIREKFAASGVPVRVRIGINAGEPIEEDGDLHGTSVVIAKRLESAADVNGILVSDVVKQAVAGKDYDFEDRGPVDLKGFEEPVRAWAVRWE